MVFKVNDSNKPLEIKSYKSFNANGTNVVGNRFEVGVTYHCDGEIKFGPRGNGYHFAKNMEDTIRYSDYDSEQILRNVLIAEVIGSGIIAEGTDEYNGYFDLYAASDIKILKYLTRQEVISLALNLHEFAMARFLSLYKLYLEEIELFKGKFVRTDEAIRLYQFGEIEKIKKIYCKTKK